MFTFPKFDIQYAIPETAHRAISIESPPLPCDWIEDNIRLPFSYAMPGKISLEPWQCFIVNLVADNRWKEIVLQAATQLGKSFMFEMMQMYLLYWYGSSFFVCYSVADKAKDAFADRLRPLIEENPCLKKLTTGNNDDLTIDKMTLRNAIIRIATAAARSSIASAHGRFVYASEVSKYRDSGFDVLELLKNRYQAFLKTGNYKFMLESSPYEKGDIFDEEINKPGNIHVYPFVPCPFECGEWFVMEDRLIKERPNEEGKFDHDPTRIRLDGAAYLECPRCKREVEEKDHLQLLERVVWARNPDEIKDGINAEYDNYRGDTIVCFANRLLNYAYKFSDCLSNFFEALYSTSPSAKTTYDNEHMARAASPRSSVRVSENYLASKCQENLFQYSTDTRWPNDILCAVAGIDTHDEGFYVVVRGWCRGMKSYLLFSDFIICDHKDTKFIDPHNVFTLLASRAFHRQYVREDDSAIPIIWGLMDRGGHRAQTVDRICTYLPILHPYIGSTFKTAALVEKSKNGNHYMGNTERLSELVEKWSQTAGCWVLPADISNEYMRQFLAEYHEDRTQKNGTRKVEFIQLPDNHYRSAENYAMAALYHLGLHEKLIMDNVDALKAQLSKFGKPRAAANKLNHDEATGPRRENALSPRGNGLRSQNRGLGMRAR